METVVARTASPFPPLPARIDFAVARIWLLCGGLVAYLAIDGGGYDIVVHSQASIVVWWVALLGAAWGLLPTARLSRAAWAALALFGGFVVWTALASTWSLSSERSLVALSLVAGYLGVLVLGIAVHRDREQAIRHTVGAVACAIVLVAVLALASRLRPGLFAGSDQTASYLPGAQQRLAWPLNYWNALAALLGLGLPLLLSLATAARTIRAQAAAAAAVPIVVLCGYLTFSRGGLLAFAAGLIVFVALAPDRVPKLVTVAVTGGAGAALIAGVVHRSAVEHGLSTAAARDQGTQMILPIILACAGAALAQVAIGLAARHGRRPRALMISVRQARWAIGAGIVLVIVVALALGAPSHLSHAWHDFKQSRSPSLRQDDLQRFGKVSGNGRYDYWRAALQSTANGHLLQGNGPGTFQLLWLPRAPFFSYVENAHSLYFETLAEVGLVGLILLVGFFVLVIARGIAVVVGSRDEARARAAALTAATVAFTVSAASDWIWQVPALPTAFLLLAAALLAPAPRRTDSASEPEPGTRRGSSGVATVALRAGIIVLALACVVAVAVPLGTTNNVRRSQAEAGANELPQALNDAYTAARIEPGAASPQIQIALVLEAQGSRGAALMHARQAVNDEPANWSSWLVLSRLEAETGRAAGALHAYRQARSLNPRSPVFRQ
jgi:O-Antigen ligase